eukprot:CAMPEP_0196155466 /NCGR_PEP_ID=MMETSP0910-20130528/40688_1 /TAXON_ID=49265 /ORGANISM="Thalassiosira rotula, Strain GSO102" /LENGTH=78 /DNA_ID=CAMNT_0041419681 /DNA_START=26 /DNA_END=262 /DNA_ORIENTATION=-
MTRAQEERALLLAACDCATRRVVVKRPVGAEPLGLSCEIAAYTHNGKDDEEDYDHDDVRKPSYDIRGSVNRFDVYIIS